MQISARRVGACWGAVRRTVRTHCRAEAIGLWTTMAEDALDAPMSGRIPYSIGQASAVRIPVPGMAGKRQLRLDYGHNHVTKTFDYHWNQRGTNKYFGLTGHTPVGRAGQVAYN